MRQHVSAHRQPASREGDSEGGGVVFLSIGCGGVHLPERDATEWYKVSGDSCFNATKSDTVYSLAFKLYTLAVEAFRVECLEESPGRGVNYTNAARHSTKRTIYGGTEYMYFDEHRCAYKV